jgi:hypothetical protein
MNHETPPAIAAALRASSYYFTTQLGETIPLLSIVSVRTLVKRRATEKTDLIKGNRRTDYYATLPEGCVAVAIAGRGHGRFPGESILQPGEIDAFAAALKKLEK